MNRACWLLAWTIALGLMVGCGPVAAHPALLSPDANGNCHFEATLPADITFEKVAKQVQAPNIQFCGWISFRDRKLAGYVRHSEVDARSGWEVLKGEPASKNDTCYIQSLMDAGWMVKPRSGVSMWADECFGPDMWLGGPSTALGEDASLQELCFRYVGRGEQSFDVPAIMRGMASSLRSGWTLPIEHATYDARRQILRLWFDNSFGAAWADDWAGRVISGAADGVGVALAEAPCGSV